MSWLRRLLGGPSARDPRAQRVDYLNEALTLERQGDYDAALTSYKLALRDHPQDHRVLQSMAIAYSKTGRHEEAVRYADSGAVLLGEHTGSIAAWLPSLIFQAGHPGAPGSEPGAASGRR